MFLVGSENVLLLAFLKYVLYIHCTENCIFVYLCEVKNPCLWQKIDSRKTSITQEQLVIEFLIIFTLIFTFYGGELISTGTQFYDDDNDDDDNNNNSSNNNNVVLLLAFH